jgi:predicted deacylase
MRELGLIDAARPSSAVREIVEDPRDGAGVLQSKHIASIRGFYQPTVALGDHVRAGDSIGTISSSLGEEIHTVPAECTGIILMLRALPSVARGEALAAILPDDAPRRENFL